MSEPSGPAVLITRPEPGAQETAARLRAGGFTPVLAPMLTIQPGRIAMAGPVQAILVTSANAIAALPDAFHDTRLLAVGDATAARARQAGFRHVESAGRDAQALAVLVASSCDADAGKLLLASGAGQGLALAQDLRARGFVVQRRIAYRASPVMDLPDRICALFQQGDIKFALFFSPATARAFVTCITGRYDLAAGVEALAISQATARVLSLLPWRRIRVASHPNQDELVALLS